MLQRKGASSLPVPEAIENEVICMRLAQSIIEDFSNVAEDHPKYTFPFLHYLTSATIIALGLIIKQSSFKHTYGGIDVGSRAITEETLPQDLGLRQNGPGCLEAKPNG